MGILLLNYGQRQLLMRSCNKARLLLMAAMLKLGRLPKARDPRNPTRQERAATVAAVTRFQEIFENH